MQYVSVTRCPFCGKSLFESTEKDADLTVGNAIKLITERFGMEILNDSKRFLAIFSDAFPDMKQEKKILTIAFSENIGQIITKTSSGQFEAAAQRIRDKLELIMAESAINMVITAIAEVFSNQDKSSDPEKMNDLFDPQHMRDADNSLPESFKLRRNESPNPIISDNVENVRVPPSSRKKETYFSRDDLIKEMKECFVPMYSLYSGDMFWIGDDPGKKPVWYKTYLSFAKKTFAKDIGSDEHIFFVKKGDMMHKQSILISETQMGFVLTEKYLYIGGYDYSLKIKASGIIWLCSPSFRKKGGILYIEYTNDEHFTVKKNLLETDSVDMQQMMECLDSFRKKCREYRRKTMTQH